MARQVSNVDIITDSYEIWLLETNELLNSLSTEIITANSTYANTGNSTFQRTAQLYGTFGANNLMVTNWMRGGNVNGSFANLYISTNTVLSNTAAANLQFAVSNSTSNSYLNPIGVYLGLGTANAYVNTTAMVVEANSIANTFITANSIILQSNSIVNSNFSDTLIQIANSTSTANMNATSFQTGIFTGNTTAMSVGANVVANATTYLAGNSSLKATVDQTSLRVGNSTVNTVIVSDGSTSYIDTDGYLRVLGNAAFSNTLLTVGATTLQNTLSVTGAANVLSTFGVGGAANLLSTLGVTGAANLSSTLGVVGAADLSSTLGVVGAATLSNTLAVTGNTTLSNLVTIQSEYVIDVNSNTNIGTNISTPVRIYRFPKATYSSAKLTIQVKNQGNTQISEALIAHDGTTGYSTVYGTVASPGFANNNSNPLGTFIANVNGANVDLLINQTVANSATKIVAHLIK